MKTKEEIQKILLEKWLHVKDDTWLINVIEPLEIASKNQIVVKEIDLSPFSDQISGFIKYDKENNSFIVGISEKEHEYRKRFTLAHELGHYFLHIELLKSEEMYIEQNILFRSWIHSDQEQEANMFAAEYLMPESKVRELYERYWVIEILAWYFNVSNLAMAYRIDNLIK